MFVYEDDVKAVNRVLDALREGEFIDDATARTIASWCKDPDGRVKRFQLTGEIFECNAMALWRAFDKATVFAFPNAFRELAAYLVERVTWGNTEAVSGWDRLWVKAHVDYPHQDGALDTCWCFDESDD